MNKIFLLLKSLWNDNTIHCYRRYDSCCDINLIDDLYAVKNKEWEQFELN